MNELDHRQLGRDSFFLMADVRLDGSAEEFRVKVRNLSAGGMMAEGPVRVLRGTPLKINIRNIGWIEGVVAWIQDNRFGVAFLEDIDPQAARAQQIAGESAPRFVRPPIATPEEPRQVRKI